MSGVHQSPAASAEPVSAWIASTWGASGARPVVPVGDGQVGEGDAAIRARTGRSRAARAGPSRGRRGRCRPRRGGAARAWVSGPAARPAVTRRRRRARPRRARSAAGRGRQRLVEVGDEVVDVLEADRQPDEVVGHAGPILVLGAQLRVGRPGRVDDQRLGVADVGQQAEDLDASISLRPASTPPLTPKVRIAAEAALEVLGRLLVGRRATQARVADPGRPRGGPRASGRPRGRSRCGARCATAASRGPGGTGRR